MFKRILILSASVGNGHTTAAESLKKAFEIKNLADEVRHAEALYWFSDFQDEVDDEQMAAVLENLKRRRQKLFIHASDMGNSFEMVRDKICIPSGGSVIEGRK